MLLEIYREAILNNPNFPFNSIIARTKVEMTWIYFANSSKNIGKNNDLRDDVG